MMARNGYDTEFLSDLKSKNDIVEVISKYIPLEQKGRNYWGRCPFHHEKTASFCITREEQFYHCFGCGKSGDVINFIMEFEAVDFMEAVRILADRAKITLPDFNYDSEQVKAAKEKKEKLLSVLSDTAHFYYNNLKSGGADKHLLYLSKRGITAEIIKRFGLGASIDYESLPKYLLQKGHDRVDLLESGVCSEKNGRLYDFEAGRLIIPIINAYNQVIAFGGRVLEKTDFAKYKNTSETSVFIKNKTLFNINNLKKIKNEKGLSEIIMVEGYMDTIALSSSGFENVVASMGTSLTKEQARLLKRYSSTVLICYDGDSAGQKATVRGLDILSDEGLTVKVVSLPDGLDPDDIIKQRGKEAYQKCLDESKPLIDFKLSMVRSSYDLSKPEEKRKYTAEALAVVKSVESKAEQEDLLKAVRNETGTTLDALKRDLENTKDKKVSEPDIIIDLKDAGDKEVQAQRTVLYAMLTNKNYSRGVDINTLEFTNPVHVAIAKYISDERTAKRLCKPDILSDIFDGKDLDEANAIREIGFKDFPTDEEIGAKYFNDCVKTVKREKLEREINALTKMADGETDRERLLEIVARLSEKTAEHTRLS